MTVFSMKTYFEGLLVFAGMNNLDWAYDLYSLPMKLNPQGEVDHMAKDLAQYIEGRGFKTIESHVVFIHRSLARETMVYEKT